MLIAALLSGCTLMEKEPERAEAQARMVLKNTSIENLNRQGVYAKYGKPFAVIRMQAGKTGWVYRRGHYKLRGLRYVVVFDDTGAVVDFLYLPYVGGKPFSKTQFYRFPSLVLSKHSWVGVAMPTVIEFGDAPILVGRHPHADKRLAMCISHTTNASWFDARPTADPYHGLQQVDKHSDLKQFFNHL